MRFVLSALFLTLTGLCARRLSCCRAAHEFGGWQARHARAHTYFGVWSLEFGVWSLEFGVWNLEFGVALFPGFRVGTTRDRQHDSLSCAIAVRYTVSFITNSKSCATPIGGSRHLDKGNQSGVATPTFMLDSTK